MDKIKRRLVEFLAVERLREREKESLMNVSIAPKSEETQALVAYKPQAAQVPVKRNPSQSKIKAPILL